MLSREQREEFETRGITRLRGAVDPVASAALCDEIWRALEANAGVSRESTSEIAFLRPSAKATRALKKGGAFDLIYCKAVCQSADELLGRNAWHKTPAGPGLLLTLPGQDSWILPHKVWHFDYRCPAGREGIPGVQPFLCLDRVEPRGGGTLVLTGSHRLVERIQRRATPGFKGDSRSVRQRLAREVPFVRDLFSKRPGEDRTARFMDHESEHEGIPLRVAELVGEPGDVTLMHPWIVHSLSSNCSERARLVLTDRLRSKAHPF